MNFNKIQLKRVVTIIEIKTFRLTINSSNIKSAIPSLVSRVVMFIVALIVFSIIF